MTMQSEAAPVKAPEAVPTAAEGVNMEAAMKAFREERAKDKAADAEEPKTTSGALKEKPIEEPAPATEREETQAEPDPTATTVDIPEKDALKVKLRGKVAARQRDLEERERRLAAWESENKQRSDAIEARNKEIAEQQSSIARLQELQRTNPREFLKQTGIQLQDLVTAELAEMSPEARAKQMAKTMADLPRLIQEEAKKLVANELAEREKTRNEELTKQHRLQAVAQSEQGFINRIKAGAEKFPNTAKVAERDPRYAVHTAYYIQSVFNQEHGRPPYEHELDSNVERYLSGYFGGESAERPKSANGKKATSPRAAAKEITEKPLSEMSEEERMAAAAREFRRIREADKSEE